MPPIDAKRMLIRLLASPRLPDPERATFQGWLARIEAGVVKTLAAKQRVQVETWYYRFGLANEDVAAYEAKQAAYASRAPRQKAPVLALDKPLKPPSRKAE